MSPEDDDLPTEIRDRLQSLRRELAPSDLLEERVVRDLRARGFLQSRRPWFRPASWTAGLAAGLLLFVSGWMAGKQTPPQQGAVSAAEQVEQAGDELVQALTTVARQTSSEEDDARLEQVILLLDEASGKSSRAPSEPNQVFWF